MPPAMPPLGPPYAGPVERPPTPRYPAGPPEQWPVTPVIAPPLTPAPLPPGPGWFDDQRHRVMVWGGVAVVIAVIVGVLVGRSSDDTRINFAAPTTSSESTNSDDSTGSTDSSDSTSSESDTTTTTEPQDLQTVVLEIERFVEADRGLRFKRSVDVSLAPDGEFQQDLLAEFDKQKSSITENQQVLRALGLITPDLDLVAAERSLLSIGVVGFYDPATKRLLVRASEITPFTREVLAHELTHALDDQWFDLNRPQLDDPDDESGYGFLGLVEGNARRVEDDYVATLSSDEQDQALNEQQDLVLQHPEILDLPQILLTLEESPYTDGPKFVHALLRAGGQARLDSSFALPPVTSEQILQPDKYLAGEGPVAVPAPKADGTLLNKGALGELLIREMLFDSVPSAAEVNRAIDGWGGDSYVTWADASGRSCLRDTFVGDTPTDTNELVQAITEWGQDRDVVIDAPAGGPATFTACA